MPRIDESKLSDRFNYWLHILQERLILNDIDVLFYCGFRSCEEQARIWRSTRSTTSIKATIQDLGDSGYDFIAKVIHDVGPQRGTIGRHLTNAIPGRSAHNYGMAVDGVIMVGGKPDWEMAQPGKWRRYGELAKRCGLEWAGDWDRFREYVHVQLVPVPNFNSSTPETIRTMLDEAGSL